MLTPLFLAAAFAADAPPEIVLDKKPFKSISALSISDQDRPGALKVVVLDMDVTCDVLHTKLGRDARFVEIDFPDAVVGAETNQLLPVAKGKFRQGSWTGKAALLTVPGAEGEKGTLSLTATGQDRASGTLPFTQCTELVPYAPPTTPWTTSSWTLTHDLNVFEPTKLSMPITMTVPGAWARNEDVKVAHEWVGVDKQSRLSLMLGAPADDARGSFEAYAESTVGLYQQTEPTTVLERTWADGVGVLVTERAAIGARRGYDVAAYVQRPGWTQSILCSGYTDSRAAPDMWRQLAAACRSIQSP